MEGIRQEVLAEVGQLNRQGRRLRCVRKALATTSLREDYAYAVTDESDMISYRLPCLLDPPKLSAALRYPSFVYMVSEQKDFNWG